MKKHKIIGFLLLVLIISAFSIKIEKSNSMTLSGIPACRFEKKCLDPDGPGPLEPDCDCSRPVIECCVDLTGMIIFKTFDD